MNNREEGAFGFSLVEVNLAILLVALGLLSIFGAFPAALRQAEDAVTDTHAALFADYVFSGMQDNAMGNMTDWTRWQQLNNFSVDIMAGINSGLPANQPILVSPNISPKISFGGNDLFYLLQISATNDAARIACLWVASGETVYSDVGTFKSNSTTFGTEFLFRGAMP